ncbi:MAG: hypothetical protein QGF59_05225, partial [Pirellulaceae bacterium]|nr:hypothetical protein [Pirellulaceae bacterium]
LREWAILTPLRPVVGLSKVASLSINYLSANGQLEHPFSEWSVRFLPWLILVTIDRTNAVVCFPTFHANSLT